MYTSNFCIQKRQQEQKQLKKLLLATFVGSALLHGILIIFLPRLLPQNYPKKLAKPMELILVDKPKPEPIETKVAPKPEPPKPEPEPTPPPQAKAPTPPKPEPTPPPQAKAPTPPKPEPTPPPKVEQPQRVMTTPDTTATRSVPSQPSPPAPTTSSQTSEPSPPKPAPEETVATNSAPPTPAPAATPAPKPTTDAGSISCVSNCQPEYPSALNGDEGSAGVRLTISPTGNVTGAQLVQAHSNMTLNRQALLAARQMKFNSIDNEAGASVVVKINFTVEGSEFDRLAKERQRQLEQERLAQQEAERQRQEAARQQEIERQRQAELERQRQEEIQQQQTTPVAPLPPVNPTSQTEQERQDEILRKFRERMENNQGN